MSPQTSPCSWPVDYATCPKPPPFEALSEDTRSKFEQMAVDFLWSWTGKRYGVCDAIAAPCLDPCPVGWTTYQGAYGHLPVVGGSRLSNHGISPCGCDPCRGLSRYATVAIPGPVVEITAVTIDGVSLDPSEYRIDGTSLVTRLEGAWPTGNADWTISYRRGIPVPVGGQFAAGRLSLELWRAYCGDKECALPQRVQTVARQGVTVAMLDSFDDIDAGHTGIWVIDSWIASVMKPEEPMRIYSPDTRKR